MDISIYRGKPVGAEQLTKEQRDAVAYFFVRLKAIDPLEYDRMMPDETTERMIKREYASSIMCLTKDRMDSGFATLHKKRMDNEPEYRFINIDKILGLMHEDRHGAAHKYFTPGLPEPESAKAARKARGREQCSKILSIFDE